MQDHNGIYEVTQVGDEKRKAEMTRVEGIVATTTPHKLKRIFWKEGPEPTRTFTPSKTAHNEGTMAGMNRQMRRSVISSKTRKKNGVRELARKVFMANAEKMTKDQGKHDQSNWPDEIIDEVAAAPTAESLIAASNLAYERGGHPDGVIKDGVGYGALAVDAGGPTGTPSDPYGFIMQTPHGNAEIPFPSQRKAVDNG